MQSLDDVADLMRANLPPGVNLREFGRNIMRWGSGSQAARQRMGTLTEAELQTVGITATMAENRATAYDIVVRLMPNNPSLHF